MSNTETVAQLNGALQDLIKQLNNLAEFNAVKADEAEKCEKPDEETIKSEYFQGLADIRMHAQATYGFNGAATAESILDKARDVGRLGRKHRIAEAVILMEYISYLALELAAKVGRDKAANHIGFQEPLEVQPDTGAIAAGIYALTLEAESKFKIEPPEPEAPPVLHF